MNDGAITLSPLSDYGPLNNRLQKEFDEYGENKFELRILEECEVSKSDDKEIQYIKTYKTYKGKWMASVRGLYLGRFATKEAAARAYNEGALKYYRSLFA